MKVKHSIEILDFPETQVAFVDAEVVYSVYLDKIVHSGTLCTDTAKILYSDPILVRYQYTGCGRYH